MIDLLKKMSIGQPEEKAAALNRYMEGVLEWNSKVNLTAITDRGEFEKKHFIDSLLCAESPEFRGASSIVDVGTGGGFPGVPLAVCFPEKQFVLVDSLAKRLKIVESLCRETGIRNVRVIHGRAEDLGRQKDLREQFDACVSRAVAGMNTLAEYCLPFVRTGGFFIAYKGPDCSEEIGNAQKAIEILGGRVMRTDVPEAEGTEFEHSLVYIEKVRPTPEAYPRKAGTPAKKPLQKK